MCHIKINFPIATEPLLKNVKQELLTCLAYHITSLEVLYENPLRDSHVGTVVITCSSMIWYVQDLGKIEAV
jgi:hypothetical protein